MSGWVLCVTRGYYFQRCLTPVPLLRTFQSPTREVTAAAASACVAASLLVGPYIIDILQALTVRHHNLPQYSARGSIKEVTYHLGYAAASSSAVDVLRERIVVDRRRSR